MRCYKLWSLALALTLGACASPAGTWEKTEQLSCKSIKIVTLVCDRRSNHTAIAVGAMDGVVAVSRLELAPTKNFTQLA